MPEGDTLYRVAATLRPVLQGKVVRAVRSPLPAIAEGRLVGQTIAAIESHGKNLLITFGDGRVLHTHLQMTGSWHLYRPGVPFKKSERALRVALEVDGAIAVCFHAPIVRLLSPTAAARDRGLAALGPDCLADDFDPAVAAARVKSTAMPIGEALLYQSAVSGIGNVYKSEVLFLEGLDPFSPVTAYSDETLRAALARAAELMRLNIAKGDPALGGSDAFRFRGRTTRTTSVQPNGGRAGARGKGSVWVYDRFGEPCYVCQTPIARRYQGAANRSTYYCPACQPAGAGTRE